MANSSTNRATETSNEQTVSLSRTDGQSTRAEGGVRPDGWQLTQDYDEVARAKAPDERDFLADLATAFGDRYAIEVRLGRGGFGSVFRALDGRLNRRVAIKASRAASADQEQLLREARALAQLRHPGIVGVFDVALAGGHCFVVSELLQGPSLAEWLTENRPSPAEAVRITIEVAEALAHAHAKSIIHRDVKPSNVVFAEGFRPVLVDFGLALSAMDVASERGVVAGTPAYMSPEQAGGRAHRPDGRTDIYGLAATLYTILSGRHPFHGRNTEEVLRQVLEDEPQPPRQLCPELSPELESVCLKGMAKSPGDRYTTAADFAEALRRAAPAEPSTRVYPPAQSPPPPVESSAVPFQAPTPQLPAPPATPRGTRAERRQVTLLQCFCEAGADDDPLEQIDLFQSACAEVSAAHGGMLLQASGATFLACFGYPIALEDAPRRAVRSALEICARVAGSPVRAAVNTGPAIVTELPGAPPVVVGEVTAATALSAHECHAGVVVTDSTYRLVEVFFDCEPAGQVKPRGGAPVALYRVTAERAARNRLDAVGPDRLTPLIGRDREVALLRERWELAAEGVRGIILLVADPGLGKSRLVRVLRECAVSAADPAPGQDSSRSDSAHATVVEWYCSPYHQASPFYPITEYFDRAFQLSRAADPAEKLARLVARLREDGVHDPEEQALFAAMLSVAASGPLPALSLSPQRQKERTQAAVLNWLACRAERTAVLFVVEDLHWVDPSTEALLAQFVGEGGNSRILGLFTFRPEYDPPWKGGALQTQVALNRLTRSQVAEMIRAQTGDSAFPREAIDRIAERTDGVPLFVEEFTRLAVEGGSTGVIPATLQDLLLARLDRMASLREVVQLGAVIGRTFSYAVIRQASGLGEALLRAELDKLVGAGLLFPKGTHPRTTYTFKHALIQDAAYQSLVKKQRQQFHRTVAAALEREFPEVPETQPELLARHHAEAGAAERAIEYGLKAGQRARERSAYVEAVQHLKCGLELLATLPPAPARDETEFGYQLLLSSCYLAYRGYAAPEVEKHILRARELCERLGTPLLFDVMMINWALRFIRGRNREVQALSAELVELAEARDDDGCRAEAHWAAGCSTFWAGDFARSLDHLTRAERAYCEPAAAEHAKFTQQNSGPLVLSYTGLALWALGRPEQALRETADAVALAKRLNHPFTRAAVTGSSGLMFVMGCDPENAIRYADETLAVAEEQSFAFWVALPRSMKGAAMCMLGRYAEAVQLLRDGLSRIEATGAEIVHQMFLGWLARALWHTGDRAGAWSALGRAFEMTERDAERYFESELYRYKAEFLCGDAPDSPEAAECLSGALAVARQQGAKFFELRAALALGRLWKRAGRVEDARALVGGVAAAFTEGFETVDLAGARAFLVEMAPA